jgi:hypothetical protein
VLIDAIEERGPICHLDPGVAHPDVEIALILLLGLLRELRIEQPSATRRRTLIA